MSSSAVRAGQAFVEIGADPRKFFAALGKINARIGKLGASMSSAGTKMAAVGAGVVGPIFASAKAFSSVGSELNDMSKRTGVATESLSVLRFAAEQTGTDMAGVETAVKKMQKAIFAAGNGSKEAAEALSMVGLSASDLAGLSADQQMGKIADGLMAIEDPGARAAVAMKIFGKSGTDILPMLEGGSAGMASFAAEAKRLGLVMDTETAAKADSLGDALDALGAAMKMAFIQIGSAVAPMLTKLAGGLATFAAGVGKTIRENESLVVAAFKLGAALAVAGGGLFALGKTVSFASSALGGISGVAGSVFAAMKSVGSVVGFVGASFYKTITGVLAYSAASVASAVASGAAWAAANAPLLILLGLLGAAGAAAIVAAGGFAGIAEAIGGGLNQAAADGMVVLSDLAATATTTFNGIYAAVAAGDLAGAMDVLWAGLLAGWLRGVEALMGYVDPWIATFQNVFTYAGTEIAVVWDQMWTGLSATANTIGAYLMGAFDNIINGVLAAWDTLEAGILKSWNYIQSFFREGFDLKAENSKVDSQMAARARERELARPGIQGRTEAAAAQNEQAAKESQDRVDAMRAGADATAQGRFDANDQRAADRRAATMGAEAALGDLVRGQAETRARGQQAEDLGTNIANVGSMDGLRELADEFHTLKAAGRLTSEQESKLAGALDSATERLMGEGATIDPAKAAEQGAAGAGLGGQSQAEVAGTFSSVALGGMGFGSSLAQKQLDMLGKIEQNTSQMSGAEVAA